MKKLLILISFWLLNVEAGEKTEWYVQFSDADNVIHKCSRDMYNEYRELIESEPTDKDQTIYMHYQFNESVYYTENHENYVRKSRN